MAGETRLSHTVLRYGRSIAGTDFPVSDILHVLKKLRNNNKYLSTRVLLFAYLRDISVANRLKFSARWECVVELWHSDEKFRDAISKSSVALTDKQDPSLAGIGHYGGGRYGGGRYGRRRYGGGHYGGNLPKGGHYGGK